MHSRTSVLSAAVAVVTSVASVAAAHRVATVHHVVKAHRVASPSVVKVAAKADALAAKRAVAHVATKAPHVVVMHNR